MAKGNTTDNDVLKALLQGTDMSYRGNATIYLALHTADPTSAGTQTSNEATYTSYARVAVTKATDWDDNGTNFTNAVLMQFPTCTGGTNTVTHVSIGVSNTPTAGQLLYIGALNSSLAVSNGIQPQFSIGALTVTEA